MIILDRCFYYLQMKLLKIKGKRFDTGSTVYVYSNKHLIKHLKKLNMWHCDSLRIRSTVVNHVFLTLALLCYTPDLQVMRTCVDTQCLDSKQAFLPILSTPKNEKLSGSCLSRTRTPDLLRDNQTFWPLCCFVSF